jgi:hypothetical protein
MPCQSPGGLSEVTWLEKSKNLNSLFMESLILAQNER